MGIAVLSFFSSGILVILILMCGIAVSSSLAICGFSSFSLNVFSKRRSFMVLWHCSFALSSAQWTIKKKERLLVV